MEDNEQYTLGKLQATVEGIKELLVTRLNGLETRVEFIESKYAEKDELKALSSRVTDLEKLIWKAVGLGCAVGFLLPHVFSWLSKKV